LLYFLTACASTAPYVWVSELPQSAPTQTATLRAGDSVQVVVRGQDSMSGEFAVRSDGNVVVPVAGSLKAEGLTPGELAAVLTKRLHNVVTDPRVTIVISQRRASSVSVLGEVRTPGRYDLMQAGGVLEALARAGGLTEFADPDQVYVIRRDKQPTRVRFTYDDLTAGDPASIRFELEDGDVVVVE
jgi:polysaccharide export outer membrane protein